MHAEAAASAVELLIAARRQHRAIDDLPEACRPTDAAAAYAIQDLHVPAILAETGGRIVGYKAGATADGAQKMLGLPGPFRGVLISTFVHQSPAVLGADDLFVRVVEGEFAFRLAEDLPPPAAPYDLAGVRAAVGSVITAIEVVDTRFAAGLGAGGYQVIADNGAAGHWISGHETEDLDAIDFEDHDVALSINGAPRAEGNSANVLGSPLNSLTWLANDLCQNGKGLKAGDIVTTGSCFAPTPADPGDVATVDFGPLGQVSVTFAA